VRELPTGTITFLFTDIERSTGLWERYGQAMRGAMARHDRLLQQLIAAHHGVVFKTVGDACCAAFTTAPEAVAASLAIQRAISAEPWGEVEPLRVRIALHTGLADQRDGDYFGLPLSRIARLLAAGHGGQILLSLATMELTRDHLPDGTSLRDLGEHRLRDLTRPERIFQLAAPDLPADFPPLRTIDRTNLPAQATPLIGREREIATVVQLLRQENIRLVTLIGPGGSGKTRLGLQVAADLVDDFGDGVTFVALAPITDPALVTGQIAQAIGHSESGGQPLAESLKALLRNRHMLLLLDNFEQVVDAAPLVAELLADAPQMKVLVTSRAMLRISGEHEFAVPPLALPDRQGVVTYGQNLPAALSQYEAVRLFIDRARAVKSDFVVTNDNAPAVAEICFQLDGLPLAIELAAARSRLLSPQSLLARLNNRLGLLTGGPRDLPARQQTLRATIEWSYNLLTPEEQVVFARLGVFVGGCTLEAAEAVAADLVADDPDMHDDPAALQAFQPLSVQSQFSMLNLIESLVDKSLLRQVDRPGDEPRFIMLETIREYAFAQLNAQGEEARLRRRHVRVFLTLAEAVEPQMQRAERHEWLVALRRLDADYDNLRAALEFCLGEQAARRPSDPAQHMATPPRLARLPEVGLRLVGALAEFWWTRGYLTEGRAWAAAALEANVSAPVHVRAKVLARAGTLAQVQGDARPARAMCEEAVALYGAIDHRLDHAWALRYLGYVLWEQGDYTTATDRLSESLELCRALGDQQGSARALHLLGHVAVSKSDYARALAYLEDGLATCRALDYAPVIANSLNDLLGVVARYQGDYARAQTLLDESLARLRESGYKRGMAMSLYHLGFVLRHVRAYARARAAFEESLFIRRELGDRRGMADCLAGLASVLVAESSSYERARPGALLLGASAALHSTAGGTAAPVDRADAEQTTRVLRNLLGPDPLAQLLTEGGALSLDQVAGLIHELPAEVTPAPDPVAPAIPAGTGVVDRLTALTARELDVLRLVAQGLTDAQVAERLTISRRTVHSHLSSIYSKLGVTTRSAATRYAIEHGLA
jgi:predicted ATPase/class 3 adenylate cyclase/DNA-binding CsgD family transcriptional regulator